MTRTYHGLRHLPVPHLVTAAACRGAGPVRWHLHQLTEIVVVARGDVTIEVQGAYPIRGSPGTVLVLPADRPHRQLTADRWRTLCLLMHPGVTRSWDDEPRAVTPDPTGATLQWAEQLCMFFAEPEPNERLLDGLLFTFIERLIVLDRSVRTQADYHPVVSAALDIFVDNLDTHLAMKEIAKRLGCSYVHFGRLFRDELGSGPLGYHTGLRLDRAKQLLLNPYLPVSQVGAACGFEDLNYFVRLFRRRFGLPPGAWRNEHVRTAALREPTATHRTDHPAATDFIDSSVEIALEVLQAAAAS